MSNSQLPLLALPLAFGASRAPATVFGAAAQAWLSGKASMVFAAEGYFASGGAPVRS